MDADQYTYVSTSDSCGKPHYRASAELDPSPLMLSVLVSVLPYPDRSPRLRSSLANAPPDAASRFFFLLYIPNRSD